MTEVVGLGYVGLYATDLEAWRTYGTEVLGLQDVSAAENSDDQTVLLRADERGWRFAIHRGDAGGAAYVGWEVANRPALDALGERLAAAGVAVEEDPDCAAVRRVEGLLRCTDADGNRLEFFYGARVPKRPFVSPRGVRFVTGDLGLGHVFFFVTDLSAAKEFYLDTLGFRLSDTIEFHGRKVHFLHVNPRHHSLAFVQNDKLAPALGHFMLEVDHIDDVGRTLDEVNTRGVQLTETLGRHTNDLAISFFMKNPSGSEVEYGYDGRLVDDATWRVSNYDATSLWGHHRD
ncbi:VOC family protein [Rhodococcus maanshanensis]|uniref:3,4-dihydroxy-9,10-secoandrosta-1,3,5(10)-triene-9,17-dione 4,5-dioxygenase n=1 Tax=Rhodococcus maanshanensis TaxID=183556 RepID=A0A1H7I1W6_9NOCA|nr:VOC family protein [Rhodococcus maanshanensis]SEK56546.1 3,4-dihydroxy-9,10-secoandrosta-1,3,5(10)-triene-9,17-dione 4,5-dioxygenase [Rhodococcus maanshanensis]